MSFFFTTPFKIFMTALSVALLVTFGSIGVEMLGVHNAAQVAAYDVANSTANPNTVATAGAQSVIHGGNITATGTQNNGIGYASVTYTPPAGMSNLFSWLGVPNPNRPIVMTAQEVSNPTLATLSASPNTTGVGGAITLAGQLKIVGSVTGTPNVTFSDNGAGGSFSGQSVSLGVGVYNFSVTYTTPASIPGNQTSELIKITATLAGASSTAITAQTFVLVTQAPSSSGVSSVTAGTGISIGGTSSNPVINNTGVLGVGAGTGISVSSGQYPTVTNTGVLSVNGMTGAVNVSTFNSSQYHVEIPNNLNYSGFGQPTSELSIAGTQIVGYTPEFVNSTSGTWQKFYSNSVTLPEPTRFVNVYFMVNNYDSVGGGQGYIQVNGVDTPIVYVSNNNMLWVLYTVDMGTPSTTISYSIWGEGNAPDEFDITMNAIYEPQRGVIVPGSY